MYQPISVVPPPPTVRPLIPLYRDLGKTTNELFTKGFPNTYRFEYTTVAENGLKFVTVAEKKTRKSTEQGKDTQVDYFYGSFQPKVEIKSSGINYIGTIDTDKIASELSVANLFTNGLKATFKGSATEKAIETSGEVEFKNESASVNVGVIYKDSKPKLDFSTVIGHQGFLVGGQVGYFLPVGNNSPAVEGFSVGTNYSTSKFDVLVAANGKYDDKTSALNLNVNGKLLYNHDANTQFATDVTYDLNKSFPNAVTVKGLAQYKFDANTTGKVKVDTAGNVGLAFSQKLNPALNLTLGSEINVLKLEEQPKFGFSLAFTP
jgi:hypothetical protein